MLERIIQLVMCHLVGDYVLQTDFIANSKGNNWYHLFVHCALYVLPFYVTFGLSYKILILFATHILVDALKARYKKIDYATDQIAHYFTAFILYSVL